jgi:hypothetical protein
MPPTARLSVFPTAYTGRKRDPAIAGRDAEGDWAGRGRDRERKVEIGTVDGDRNGDSGRNRG